MTNPIAPIHRPAASRLLPLGDGTVNFKQPQLTQMRPGQHAEVAVDAYPRHPLIGKVESFVPGNGTEFNQLPAAITKIARRIGVRIKWRREGQLARQLWPGLSVAVTVDACDQGGAVAANANFGAAVAKPVSGQSASAR